MGRILIGGARSEDEWHSVFGNELVRKLEEFGHKPEYFDNYSSFRNELYSTHPEGRYDLVIYSTRLSPKGSSVEHRLYHFLQYGASDLEEAMSPVMVLVDKQIAGSIKTINKVAGFYQIKEPYSIDKIVCEVNTMISHDSKILSFEKSRLEANR